MRRLDQLRPVAVVLLLLLCASPELTPAATSPEDTAARAIVTPVPAVPLISFSAIDLAAAAPGSTAQPASSTELAMECSEPQRPESCFATAAHPGSGAQAAAGHAAVPAAVAPLPEISSLKLAAVGLLAAVWIASRRLTRPSR